MSDDLETNIEGKKPENLNESQNDDSSPSSSTEPKVDTSNEQVKPDSSTPNFEKNKLSESIGRFGSTGQVRATVFAGIGALALVSGILFWAFSGGEEQQVQAGNVILPTTDATASATVTPEQAAFIRAQQEQQAQQASMNGETYISAILTEREQTVDLSGNPTQPGLAKAASNQEIETPNGTMSSSQIDFMERRGYGNQPVNSANGEVPKNVYGQPISGLGQTNQNGQPQVSNSYQIKPYRTAGSNNTESGTSSFEQENGDLTKAAADVDKWQSDYAQLRLKKAQAVDKKTQLAFEAQVKNLSGTNVIKKVADQNPTYQTYRFTNTKKQYDQFGREIGGTTSGTGVSFNASAPKTQDINGNGFVAGESSVDSKAGQKPIIRAGESVRAILTTGVNTDEGTDVTAKIQSGPLKGSTVMGTVHITNENIQFRFNRLLRKDKDELSITAVARQLGTNKSGMADDVQKHYVQRYTALAVSSALSGYGEAYQQTAGQNATITGTGTVVTQSTDPSNDRIIGNIVGELGDEISNEVKKTANRKPTYITNSGKVFNLFFSQSVLDTSVASSVSTNVKR